MLTNYSHPANSFANLPKPKESDWELELPEEETEIQEDAEGQEEDSEIRDARLKAIRDKQEALEFKRRSQAVQRGLPRPSVLDLDAVYKASYKTTGIEGMITQEMALLVASDALKFPVVGGKVVGSAKPLRKYEDDVLDRARLEILMHMPKDKLAEAGEVFERAWVDAHGGADTSKLPGLDGYGEDEIDEKQVMLNILDVRKGSNPPSLL